METIISIIVIAFTILAIAYVELLMHRKPLTEKEIDDYQKVLDEMDAKAKADFGLNWKHDALTELMGQKRQTKSLTLIFSGIFLAFVLIALACISTLSLVNIGIICISAIVLICYGLIKISESRKWAIIFLSFALVFGSLARFAFDDLLLMSPHSYMYLCGLVVVLAALGLISKKK